MLGSYMEKGDLFADMEIPCVCEDSCLAKLKNNLWARKVMLNNSVKMGNALGGKSNENRKKKKFTPN